MIDARPAVIGQHIKEEPSVAVTYFLPEAKKAGGQYVTVSCFFDKRNDYTVQSSCSDKYCLISSFSFSPSMFWKILIMQPLIIGFMSNFISTERVSVLNP